MKNSQFNSQDLPSKIAFGKLEIPARSTIQFCNFDWIAIQKDSNLTLYKEGLKTINEIDLTQLFGKRVDGRIQVHFFLFQNGSNDEPYMLLIGNNQFVLFDSYFQNDTCKMSLNEEYRLKKKLKFDSVKIQEKNQILYILTDHFDLITLDLTNRESEFQYNALMKNGNYFASWLPQNYINLYVQDADFQFLILREQILIVQQTSSDVMRLILCNQSPYYTLAILNEDLALQNLSFRINIGSIFLSENNEKAFLNIVAVIQHKEFYDKPIQIKLIQKEIKIDQNKFQVVNPNFYDLNELPRPEGKFMSYIFQNENQLLVLYSLDDSNYYHQDPISQPREFQYFFGKLQGIGIQESVEEKSLKICLKERIYTIQVIVHEETKEEITHFPERCQNELIFNQLKEGYQQYSKNPNSHNAHYLKLEFQPFKEEQICQVIHQIVWDFMEAPVHKYQKIADQLEENKKKLELWKQYTKTVVKNRQIILNIIRSQICLEVGLYINKHEQELKEFISSCLNEWMFLSQYENQFYSKLEDLTQIIQQLINQNDNEIHLLNILTLIYSEINHFKESEGNLTYAKFWVNDDSWLDLLYEAIMQIKYREGLDLSILFKNFIKDCAYRINKDGSTSESLLPLILQFREILSEELFQEILVEYNLYQILYQCYLQSDQKMNKIFEIIKADQNQCKIFIDMCIEHVKENTYEHQHYKRLDQILDQIEEKECVEQVLLCLKEYPKLYNVILIRTKKLKKLNQSNLSIPQLNDNAECYQFLTDTAIHIANQEKYRMEVE